VVSDDQNPGPPPASAVPTAAVPTSGTPAAPAASGAPKKRRRILLVVAIVVAFLVLLGGSIGVVAYDRATAIDRSTPEVVIRQFVGAAAIDHDLARANLFVCGQWSAADALTKMSLPTTPNLSINWGVRSVTQNGDQAQADVRVILSVPAGDGAAFRDVHIWHLTLVNQNGWRVCDLEAGPSVNE
jgi:hypothetical protein